MTKTERWAALILIAFLIATLFDFSDFEFWFFGILNGIAFNPLNDRNNDR